MAVVKEPSPGDIGLVRIRGAEGRWIRVGQWLNGDGYSDFEHAFVYVGAGQLVEAEPGGARLSALGEYGWAHIVWLRCPEQYQQAVAAAARELVDVPYSFADYGALALHRLRIPVPGLRGYIRSTKHLICSQLAVLAARRGGWDILGREWDGYVTPGALRELAEAQAMEGTPA